MSFIDLLLHIIIERRNMQENLSSVNKQDT